MAFGPQGATKSWSVYSERDKSLAKLADEQIVLSRLYVDSCPGLTASGNEDSDRSALAKANKSLENNSMKFTGGYAIALLMLSAVLSAPLPAQEATGANSQQIEPEAMGALDQMGAYLRTLKAFQVQADVTEEDVLTDGQKVQFANTTKILARVPDRLLAEVDGDRKTRRFVYDGKTFTLFAERAGYYATVPAPPTIIELVDILYEKYDVDVPFIDLFLWGGKRQSSDAITSASDIGPGQVGGITCEQYAFRQPGLDWQIWIQQGDYPLPKKLVLTTTTDDARPQHTSVFTWNLAPSFNEESFVFDPPPGANRIVFGGDNAPSTGGKN
jgi:hypothetical protein